MVIKKVLVEFDSCEECLIRLYIGCDLAVLPIGDIPDACLLYTTVRFITPNLFNKTAAPEILSKGE